jgi:hypothetical protein
MRGCEKFVLVRRFISVKKIFCLAAGLLVSGVAIAQDHPKVETFVGYDFTRFNSATGVPAFSANGGDSQLAIDFNKYLGFVGDFGGVHNGNISSVHLDTTLVNFLFGPRVSLRHSRVTPYLQVLAGGVHAGTSGSLNGILTPPPTPTNPIYLPGQGTVTNNTPVTLRAVAAQTAFAWAPGGGLDIKLSHHVTFRPIELDYFMTRLQNLRSLNDNNQHNLRYLAGLNFTFGGERALPPPPPTKACWDGSTIPVAQDCPKKTAELRLSATPSEVCPGGTMRVAMTTQPPPGATYHWTVNGQAVSNDPSMLLGSTGRDPGTYKATLVMSAPDYNDATADTNVTILGYREPSGTLGVSPSEIWVGEKATLSPNFSPGQCGGNLSQPVITASEGSLSGVQYDSTDVRFDPAVNTEQRKTVNFAAKVTDEKGGSASAQASLIVKKAAKIQARRLPDIVFPANNARVNNCGKRVLLEELKPMLESDPNGSVVLIGHSTAVEAGKADLDHQRALNAAAVISAGQGICYAFPASKVLVGSAGTTDNGTDYQSRFCAGTQEMPGSIVRESDSEAKYRRVEVWFVPSGGILPTSAGNAKDAASQAVSAIGCPR